MDAIFGIEAAEEREGPWSLPKGWCWATLDDVTDGPQYGWTTSAAPTGNVQFLRTTDISSGQLDWDTVPFCLEAPDNIERLKLHDGDIVISRAGSVGKSFLIKKPRQAVFASYLIRFRPRIEPEYLYYFLQTVAYWSQIAEKAAGIAIPNVNGSKLRAVVLPLAPLAEQKRIVARVDALFAEIAEGEAALAEARKGLDTFRRALLKAAVTGELTKDWREKNPVTETGHDLLARIRAEREARAPAKGRGKRAPEAVALDTSSLPKLPNGWAWATLGEIAESVRNGTSAAPRAEANRNEVLRISSVRPLLVDETQIRFLTDEQAQAAADATVMAGDLLFTRYNGSTELVGVGAVYRGVRRYYPDKIIRVRLFSSLASQVGFVELSVNTWTARKHIAANIKTTAGQQGLSGESLKLTPVPLPPPAEAAEILRRVSEALSAADETRALLDAEAADAARLRQSILKAAFEGRLVPQDPEDEPASVLLARLRAEPAAPKARREVRSTKRKAH